MLRDVPAKYKNGRIVNRGLLIIVCLLIFTSATIAQTDEGLRLREMTVEGLPDLEDNGALPLVDLIQGSRYSLHELNDARDTLRVRLRTLPAYPYATLQSFTIESLAGGRSVNLHVKIDHGPIVWVRSLALSGPSAGLEKEILSELRTVEGAAFRQKVWQGDMLATTELLRENGYPFAAVTAEQIAPTFGADTVHVDLILNVQPGARVSLQRVEFAGLKVTKASTARHAARIRESLYHPDQVEAARRRLLRTEWFLNVSQGEVFADRDGKYGVLFHVEEQRTSSVAGALGYAADDEGLAGSLDATLSNLFGGGRAFDLHWRRDGSDSRAFSVAYMEPFVFGQQLSAKLHLSQEVRDSQYVAVEFGGELGAQVADEWTVSGSLRRKSITADSLAVEDDSTDYTLVGVGVAVEYDSRDRRTNPRSGAHVRIGSERLFLSGTRLVYVPGEATPREEDLAGMYRSEFGLELSVPVQGDWVGFAAINGVDVSAGGDERPPIAEWEQLGGASTVRGFSERSLLAPRVGWGSVELRRLLDARSRAYVLFDGVVLDMEVETRWEWSYGVGVQVDTGIGLLNIAVAVPGGEGFSAAVVHAQATARF